MLEYKVNWCFLFCNLCLWNDRILLLWYLNLRFSYESRQKFKSLKHRYPLPEFALGFPGKCHYHKPWYEINSSIFRPDRARQLYRTIPCLSCRCLSIKRQLLWSRFLRNALLMDPCDSQPPPRSSIRICDSVRGWWTRWSRKCCLPPCRAARLDNSQEACTDGRVPSAWWIQQ